MGYGLGIDLGSAFTAAAVNRGGAPRMLAIGADGELMPSMVQILSDGSLSAGIDQPQDEQPQVPGHLFRRRLGDSTPMLIGERSYTAVDLLAALLAAAVRQSTQAAGSPPDRVVVTCPAVWGPYRREQFAEVTRRAGLPRQQVELLSEAEAVAAYHLREHPLPGPEPLAVYDCGGSTFDATVIRPPGTGPAGAGVLGVPESLDWFGGVDVDEEIIRYLDESTDGSITLLDPRRPDEAAALRGIRAACVRAKEELSVRSEVMIDAPQLRPIALTRAQLEGWVRPQLAAGLPALRRVLDAGVRVDDLSVVLLTGGMARMPLIGRMLTEDLGRPVALVKQPQRGVALGAALVAGQLTKDDRGLPRTGAGVPARLRRAGRRS